MPDPKDEDGSALNAVLEDVMIVENTNDQLARIFRVADFAAALRELHKRLCS